MYAPVRYRARYVRDVLRRCRGVVVLVIAAGIGLSFSPASAQQLGPKVDWQWKKGRASWFGNGDWPLDIGGCNYGHLWQDERTGLDVAAMTDVHPDYVDSCGTCFEIKCDSTWTKDNYGSSFDRTHSCYDSSASLVVRIVDTCPCTYPQNWWSNKRWCCGDVDHFDISLWAFEKLAELKWGVIPLQYRAVPCTYNPPRQAQPLSNPSPPIPLNPPPNARRLTRDWPEYRKGPIVSRFVFENGYENGFWDASWNAWVQPLSDSSTKGMNGGQGLCAKVNNRGALSMKSWSGVFKDVVALEFWAYVGKPDAGGFNAKVPDITINIAGPKGGCTPVRIMAIKPHEFLPTCTYCDDYWWSYKIYLPAFAGAGTDTVINDPGAFQGCGGNGVWELNEVQFRHDGFGGSADKWFCMDHIVLA